MKVTITRKPKELEDEYQYLLELNSNNLYIEVFLLIATAINMRREGYKSNLNISKFFASELCKLYDPEEVNNLTMEKCKHPNYQNLYYVFGNITQSVYLEGEDTYTSRIFDVINTYDKGLVTLIFVDNIPLDIILIDQPSIHLSQNVEIENLVDHLINPYMNIFTYQNSIVSLSNQAYSFIIMEKLYQYINPLWEFDYPCDMDIKNNATMYGIRKIISEDHLDKLLVNDELMRLLIAQL